MGILAALPLISTIGGVIGAIKIAFSGLAFVMANPVIQDENSHNTKTISITIRASKITTIKQIKP